MIAATREVRGGRALHPVSLEAAADGLLVEGAPQTLNRRPARAAVRSGSASRSARLAAAVARVQQGLARRRRVVVVMGTHPRRGRGRPGLLGRPGGCGRAASFTPGVASPPSSRAH
ncbi:hypothetical protein HBB16_21825 [Pseudonocardia sp. MCCB 268]|nr:hypothetical protein [Pseudonocardia cytotoxica]